MKTGCRWFAALLLVLAGSGCRDEGSPSGAAATTPGRMNSLTVATPPPSSATSATAATSQAAPAPATPAAIRGSAGNQQAMKVTGGAIGVQAQAGAGNTQTMNVNAAGGNVAQQQGGAGNTQTMNIGVVDGQPPAAADAVRRN